MRGDANPGSRLSSGSVKKCLLDDFLRIMEAVPQAYEIIQGKAGRIEEKILTWDVLARLHGNIKSSIGQNEQQYLAKSTNKLDKGTVKDKEKKLKKDKDGKQGKRNGKGSADNDRSTRAARRPRKATTASARSAGPTSSRTRSGSSEFVGQ